MRISAGMLKGRRVAAGKVLKRIDRGEIRPTSAKVREALFDILRNDIADASFLDLYAGTGAVGFEALSRGAARVVFVESVRTVSQEISGQIKKMELGEKAEVHTVDAVLFLKRMLAAGVDFDIIFADPPYASDDVREILEVLDKCCILKTGGCIVVEGPSKSSPPEGLQTLTLIKRYRYGETSLTLYRKEP